MLRGVRVEYGRGGANWAGKEGKEGRGWSIFFCVVLWFEACSLGPVRRPERVVSLRYTDILDRLSRASGVLVANVFNCKE